MGSDRRLIVSASDAGYFELLQGMVTSVRDKPESKSVDLAVLDLGLTVGQRAWLETRDVEVTRPTRSIHPVHDERQKAASSRPLVPEMLPGYDVYLWIDADAWVQCWSAVELYFRAAASGALACVMSIDRAYESLIPTLRLETRFGLIVGLRSWMYDSYRACYGAAVARRLALKPTINAGVFALRGDAPQWRAWQDCYRAAVGAERRTGFDNIALNVAIFERGLRVEYLPARCNWVCSRALPKVDPDQNLLVEPYLPHEALGIVHLVLKTKHGEYDLARLDGGTERRSLRYRGP